MERRYVLFFAVALAIVITSQMLQAWLYPAAPPPAPGEVPPAELAGAEEPATLAAAAAAVPEPDEPAEGAAPAPRRRLSIGSLDHPEAVTPATQYGLEGKLPAFETLHTLPGTRTEDDIPAVRMEKLRSRQHPDRD